VGLDRDDELARFATLKAALEQPEQEAIERGEPFTYLDNVIVPKLLAAIRNDELIERLNETCRCPDTMACLSMGMCLEKRS